ncbi:MAG: PDZ domain-containing protein [candidate division WOR-3 bacterium]|nr:PDZ domain-containing protein [candidate division WOR-3 bacterium]
MDGYYRFPSINKDRIVFVCEDDLWSVPINGGIAYRLTSNLGRIAHCSISPDGEYIAFTGREEGQNEVYCISIKGGPARRLTFLGANTVVRGWTRDGSRIIFASDTGQWYPGFMYLYTVDKNKDIPEMIKVGPARTISFGPKKGVVIGRNTADPARWKRYRGGTVGEIWIDPDENGNFRKLVNLKGNLADPMWINDRIYFISDHEGIGNIYSCDIKGKDLKKHTNHRDFYVRNAKTDGKNIVYHSGGDIYVLHTDTDRVEKIKIDFRSPRVQTQRKYVDASKYLEDYGVHPEGKALTITSRGKVFSMANWEGPVLQHGETKGARYRLGRYLYDGKKVIVVTDEKGEDSLQIYDTEKNRVIPLPLLDIGRPIELEPSPKELLVALTNHRNELIIVNLKTKKRFIIDKSKYRRISGITWSPDGIWLAYSFADSERTTCIKLADVYKKKTYFATRSVLYDFAPSFDPEGKYLYFLSARHFDPVYDTMQFELSFPAHIKPYLILLRKDLPDPFKYSRPVPIALDTGGAVSQEDKKKLSRKIKIDIDGITERILPLPVANGIYKQICGIKDKVLFSTFPIKGGKSGWFSDEIPADGTISFYDFKEQKEGVIVSGITDFKVAKKDDIIIYRSRDRLRVVKPIEKVEQKLEKQPPGIKSGYIDLSRIKLLVEPTLEWQQMYRDAWRLQRDHFWTKDMSGVDWKKVYEKYLPLLNRIGTRSEFSDLIWEMQGELGTSHAYEFGGDYREEPKYTQGFLGADIVYDRRRGVYKIAKILRGDPWVPDATSPLLAPGLNIKEGDLLLEINGVRVNKDILPGELLVNRAGSEITITIASPGGKNVRRLSVKTLSDETSARYREWVEQNRELVHRLSNNKIGYVHIPDMGPWGYAEFHRYFLSEIKYSGLIVDVRFNRGGHVSQLLLERLRRKRIGYDITRWSTPEPYPVESVLGPIVAITNEYAGSDGDIFSHGFKLYRIGPLIGKRTWGGVIGISPYYRLSDGGLTTQPEYSFWFLDVGWGVENYGTEPDIEVDITPQDYVKGKDTQLLAAVRECLRLIRKTKPQIPKFGKKPLLKLPW